MASQYAFVTLLTSDHYLPGALTLAASLRNVHPSPATSPEVDFQTVCLVTPETVDVSTMKLLRKGFDVVTGVELIAQNDEQSLKLLGRPDLSEVLTKLHVFRLTQYTKIIFLDADVLPIRPLSHLFTLPYEFSAVPDVGWPDIFNSGVLVLSPGEDKFAELQELLKKKGSWDGGDQGILNEWRGNNWNRLSFTYNTTPTAAYTYAPAYERFGKEISAIHFIGPNKPWKSIQYRAPFLSQRSAQEPQASQRAYDYDSLVDKWFNVYDTHYRAQSIVPEMTFEVQRYVSAWNEQTSAASSGILDLEGLRRLAVEGINSAGLVSENKLGEGEYKSMPLEGRIDLMRPKPPNKAPQKEYAAESQQPPSSSTDGFPRTPGPNEIPPSPHPQPIPLPPTLSMDVGEYLSLYEHDRRQDYRLPESLEQHSGDFQAPAPPNQRYGDYQAPASSNEHYRDYQVPAPSKEHHEDYQAPASLNEHYGDYQVPAPSNEHHGNYQASVSSNQHYGDYQMPAPSNQAPVPQHPHQQPPPLKRYQSPPRPSSPPKLLWNPAIEPPPNTAPSSSAFPTNTYFQNIWDQPPSKRHDRTHQQDNLITSPTPDSGTFFEPPPQNPIPEPIQSHYRNVTGEADHNVSAAPNPDLTKVKAVFPWEGKPRSQPGRVFPASDPPPPSWTENTASEEPEKPPSPEPVKEVFSPSPKPHAPLPKGLPAILSYANAWDTVPSIQRYASRLSTAAVRPPPPAPLPFDDEDYGRGRKSWDDRAEASSRDGDDEDNTDTDDGEPVVSRLANSDNETSVSGSTGPTRSRRGSSVSASYSIKSKKKEYRVRGVQTISPEMKDQAVQVAILIDSSKVSPHRRPPQDQKSNTQESSGQERSPLILQTGNPRKSQWAPIPVASVLPPVISSGRGQSPDLKYSPGTGTGTGAVAMDSRFSPPPDALSPREFEFADLPTDAVRPGPPARVSSDSTITPTSMHSAATTRGASQTMSAQPLGPLRQTSNESMTSPSSAGPISPPEGQPIGSVAPPRKVGRVFDPARGVDVFKRGSEEVLARFLKMNSWDEESSPQQ